MPDIAGLVRRAVDVLYAVGPVFVILSLAFVSAVTTTLAGRWLLRLARRGFTQNGDTIAWRRYLAGTLLPFAAAVGLITSFAIEREIREGPNRAIDAMVGSADTDVLWVVQAGTSHFMNASHVRVLDLESLLRQADQVGLAAVPFWAELMQLKPVNQQSRAGFAFAVDHPALSPTVKKGARCSGSSGRCVLNPGEIVTDGGDGLAVGDQIVIRGTELTVVGHAARPRSLLNRTVVYMDVDTFTDITGTSDPYGILFLGARLGVVNQFMSGMSLGTPVEVLSTAELRAANTRFWTGNGTLLVLVLIVMITMFAAVALYSSRRAQLEHDASVLRSLRAIGLGRRQLTVVTALRGQIACLLAAVPAVLVSVGVVRATNAALIGFHASVDTPMTLGAMGLLLGVDFAATVLQGGDLFTSTGRQAVALSGPDPGSSSDKSRRGRSSGSPEEAESAEHPAPATPIWAARVERATKIYRRGNSEVRALDDLTLAFERGRFTAIMGPSGSGKSTLMRLAAGLDSVTSGGAFIGEVDVSGMREAERTAMRRHKVGFVFQAFNLVPTLTAFENITLPMAFAGCTADPSWLDEIVRATGLADRLAHRPGELSGGEQQRVAIARALVSRPDVIFADEPTGNLDSRSGAEILRFMRSAVQTLGQTIVMVTHDPVAASHADRVVFLADGQVVDEMLEPTADRVLDRMKQFGS